MKSKLSKATIKLLIVLQDKLHTLHSIKVYGLSQYQAYKSDVHTLYSCIIHDWWKYFILLNDISSFSWSILKEAKLSV